ncbi:hypothetical protein [Pseudomonas putida]|uniref:hypothetical protein n=1 Tax=Pseudomonas putida TaxID=303 RepID=UPI001E551924|nr:hypothetical protein [Pseudomonas putida]
MSGSVSAIWYNQMIEYRVAVVFQQALAQALMQRSESLQRALKTSGRSAFR